MKKLVLGCLLLLTLSACTSKKKVPDVSDVNVDVQVNRFDKDFFSIEPTNLNDGLNELHAKYPAFFPGFLVNVLGIRPTDSAAAYAISMFINSYRPVFDSAAIIAEKNLPKAIEDLQLGLRLWKHYFPDHPLDSPFVVTTFIGPMDAFEPFALGDYGDVRTRNGVGIAMQFHLGNQAGIYDEGRRAGVLYDYQTRRFTPEMMAVNSMKNIIMDEFPYTSESNNLVEEMIEKGKRLYVLEQLLPDTPDSLQLGYTSRQLKGCYENEALIWNYFVKNDLLYTKDMAIMQNYVKDGPKTAELGDGSPGYIGLFVGRQLVRSYMKNHPEIGLPQLMKTGNMEILNEGGYKP